jgi:hypothetical protein
VEGARIGSEDASGRRPSAVDQKRNLYELTDVCRVFHHNLLDCMSGVAASKNLVFNYACISAYFYNRLVILTLTTATSSCQVYSR